MNENEKIPVIQIPCKTEYFNQLREIKGTKRNWFDFLCRAKIVEHQKQLAIEREMLK